MPAICTLPLKDTSPFISILSFIVIAPSTLISPVINTLSFNIVVPVTSRFLSITTSPVKAVVSALLPIMALAGIDSASNLIMLTSNVSSLPVISLAFKNIFPVAASPPIMT